MRALINYSKYIGCKFKIHGRSLEEGFDCWGLAIDIYRQDGIELPDPHYDPESFHKKDVIRGDIISTIQGAERIEKPQIKCIIEIIVKGVPSHVAIYIGNGYLIHSLRDVGVVIEPLRKYQHVIRGFYKVSNSKRIQ